MLFKQKLIVKTKIVARAAVLSTGLFVFGQTVSYTQNSENVLNEKQLSELQQKADKWVAEAGVTDPAKAAKVASFVDQHLVAVYTWNKTHTADEVPQGVNPRTGEKAHRVR